VLGLLALCHEQDILGNHGGLTHRRAGIRIWRVCIGNIATCVHIWYMSRINLQSLLNLDVTAWGDGGRHQALDDLG